MHDAGQRAAAAVTDIGGGAGNRAGGGETAEQRCGQVGDALADQFLVGIMLAARHAVGHHRRQQRLDGPEHGNRKGRADQLDHPRQADIGQAELGQAPGNTAEGAADGGHSVELEQGLDQRDQQHRHQRARHALETRQPGGKQHQAQAEQGQQGGGRVQVR
ncbi:hypothetical protein D3C72_1923720 [compost metagenome]